MMISAVVKCAAMVLVMWVCSSKGKQRLARKDGDIILGALFPLHRSPHDTSRYTRTCGEIWEQYGIHRTEMFFHTLDKLNDDLSILPNVTLGWDVRDSCWYSPIALEQSIDFIKNSIASVDNVSVNMSTEQGCGGTLNQDKPIAGLIGPGNSENTIQVQNMLQIFHIPQIGYSATSLDLSDKNLYKFFLRVVPSDRYQAQAMLDVVIRYNWTYISTINSEGNYGARGINVFKSLAKIHGVCIASSESAPGGGGDNNATFDDIITTLLETPSARVIVCFCEGMTVRRLLMATHRNPKARGHFQIVGSDGWADRPDVVAGIEELAVGGISMKLMSDDIPTFDNYFRTLRPELNTRNPWFGEFWQWRFKCYLPTLPLEEQDKTQNKSCTGQERITSFIQDAKLGFVIKAVYAFAHALHNLHKDKCKGVPGICDSMLPIEGSLFLDYLMNVNFTINQESVFFDKNGDPPSRYYIMNYLKTGNSTYTYKNVGYWDNRKLKMTDEAIYWPSTGYGDPVRSICSEECSKAQVKKVHGNIPCCWSCSACKENEFLLDSSTCKSCSRGWWPNTNLTACRMIPVEYTTWWDTEAMVALIVAMVGICVTIWISIVFIRHNNTPVVKASTRELSYIILLGVFMAYSSNFVLVAKPTTVTCYFTRILPGMSFSLVYGALVTKTNRIARILEGTKKIITKKPRFMSAFAQVIITGLLIGVECAIVIIMLVIEPADSKLDYPAFRRVKLVCNTTTMGIIVPLGFDLLLIIMCTLYAVKTRNLPENFNEAKFIGFSMYTTCVIWLGFLAIYFGSERKVITMSVSVSLSASVALALLFFPKVYIIVWAPEKNTRSAFTTSKDVRCHIGSISCASGESIDLVREKKGTDMHGIPIHRRKSFLSRLKYGGMASSPKYNRNPQNIQIAREVTTRLKRENSFHVSVASGTDSNKAQSFSWARMATGSEEDKLSSLGCFKDHIDEAKHKRVTFERHDTCCQTDIELLESILPMPYLRKRKRRMERTDAFEDETFLSLPPFAGRSVSPRRLSASSSESLNNRGDPKRKMCVGSLAAPRTTEKRAYLTPGYSDSPLSTSDDIENEEEFEYYDSISDLLRVHSTSPNPIGTFNNVAKDGSLHQRETIPSLDSDRGYVVLKDASIIMKESPSMKMVVEARDVGDADTVLLEERTDGSKQILTLPVLLTTSNRTGTVKSVSDYNLSNSSIHSNEGLQSVSNSVHCKRRLSSPASCYLNSKCDTEQNQRCPSALQEGQGCSIQEDEEANRNSSITAIGVNTTQYVNSDETSMLRFQTFLRERGLELDMAYMESSDV